MKQFQFNFFPHVIFLCTPAHLFKSLQIYAKERAANSPTRSSCNDLFIQPKSKDHFNHENTGVVSSFVSFLPKVVECFKMVIEEEGREGGEIANDSDSRTAPPEQNEPWPLYNAKEHDEKFDPVRSSVYNQLITI